MIIQLDDKVRAEEEKISCHERVRTLFFLGKSVGKIFLYDIILISFKEGIYFNPKNGQTFI